MSKNKFIISSLNPKFEKLEKPLKKVVRILFGAFPLVRGRHLEVYLAGYEVMNKLARLYLVKRGEGGNVLAFPAPKNFVRPDLSGRKSLGEIYLNPDYIRNEKLEMSNEKKIDYMLIHGFLHLLGYDHKNDHDTISMRKKETQIFYKLHSTTNI